MRPATRTRLAGALPIPLIALLTALALALGASAQPDTAAPGGSDSDSEVEAQAEARTDRLFGGPEGVARKLRDTSEREPLFDVVPFRGYFEWKQRLRDEHGLSFGLSAYLLYQAASEEGTEGDDQAFGGVYRFQGSWVGYGRNTGHPGRLEFRVEYRSGHAGLRAPKVLGQELGAAALNTASLYAGDFDPDLAVLNWTQSLHDQRIGLVAGRLAFDVYQDAYVFQTINRAFLNRAFIVNPTIGTTGVGALGAVAKGLVTDHFWIGGQFFDANAVSGEFDFDTVAEGEFLKSIEVGWTPSLERFDIDRIELTYWHVDERTKARVPSGQGVALTASYQFREDLIAFLRYGHSDGGGGVAARNAASAGFEYSPWRSQAFSLAFGWADPSESALRDEYVIETSYRVQLTPQVSIMPDLQLLIDPAKHPEESRVWVFGLQATFAF